MSWYVAESRRAELQLPHGLSRGVACEGYETAEPVYMHLVELPDDDMARLANLVTDTGRSSSGRLALPGVRDWWFPKSGKCRWPGTTIHSRSVIGADGRARPRALSGGELQLLRATSARVAPDPSPERVLIETLADELEPLFDGERPRTGSGRILVSDEPVRIEELLNELAADAGPVLQLADADPWRLVLTGPDGAFVRQQLLEHRELLRLDWGGGSFSLDVLMLDRARGYVCLPPEAGGEVWPWLAIAVLEPCTSGTASEFLLDFVRTRGAGYGVEAFFPAQSLPSGEALTLIKSGGLVPRAGVREALLKWMASADDWAALRADLLHSAAASDELKSRALPTSDSELFDLYLDRAFTETAWPPLRLASAAWRSKSRRRPAMTRAEFLDAAGAAHGADVRRSLERLLEELSGRPGVIWEPRETGLSARLAGPAGRKQPVSLFWWSVESRRGTGDGMHFGYLRSHLRRDALPEKLADTFYEAVAEIFSPGMHVAAVHLDDRYPNPIRFGELTAHADAFVEAVGRLAGDLRAAGTRS